MNETPFYFPGEGHTLFGIFHQPERVPSKGAFVFCHPFVEEKLWAHRVFVSFARDLAAEGYSVLRFDYMGNGDSPGEFNESSLESVQADVRSAIRQVRTMTDAHDVNLLGLRLGATVASLVAEDEDIAQLVLWAPVVDGARYMQELLRINLTTQMATFKEIRHDRVALVEQMQQGGAVNIDGYELTLPMYSQVSAVKLAANVKRYEGACLITNIDKQQSRPSPELVQLAACYSRASLRPVTDEPFWKEIPRFYGRASNLFAATFEWLRAN